MSTEPAVVAIGQDPVPINYQNGIYADNDGSGAGMLRRILGLDLALRGDCAVIPSVLAIMTTSQYLRTPSWVMAVPSIFERILLRIMQVSSLKMITRLPKVRNGSVLILTTY